MMYNTGLSATLQDVEPMKFTSKERDAETGLDYFGFRYFSSAQGRWTSPDQPFADQHPEDPQSWNMYGYVRNNPLAHVDPNGKQSCAMNMSACGYSPSGPPTVKDAMIAAGIVAGPAVVAAAPESGFLAAGRALFTSLLGWALGNPDKVNQAAATVADAMAPPGTPSFNVASAAENFGFKAADAMGNMVGGELKGGGSALVSFAKSGEQFGVNISMISGPAGTLSKVEAGAINAARAEGASSLTLSASMVKDSMGRLLKQNGFTQDVKEGQATGRWIKEIKLKKPDE